MRLDTARRFALSLPEATEEPHFEKSSFRVRGKLFATVPVGGKQLNVFVDPDERLALIAAHPAAFEAIIWGKKVKPDFVCVHLAAADGAVVKELLERAWRIKAPARVVAEFDEQH